MAVPGLTIFLLLLLGVSVRPEALGDDVSPSSEPSMVKREDRKSLAVTEFGEISTVEISSGTRGPFHLQFITLDPNSLLLPVLLHADMVFYVHTGTGKLSWADAGKEMKRVNLRRGDVYRLQPGSVFFLQSNIETEREKLRVYAIFSNTDENVYEPSVGAYSSISGLILGFDKKLLQSAFKVSEDVMEELASAARPEGIVHATAAAKKKSIFWELESRLLQALAVSSKSYNGKSKTAKTFNVEDADPDFENCNGKSLIVDNANLKLLRGSNIGVLMVNLTKGSMMGPHWNPMATEIAIVLHGQGMVRIVCASNAKDSECKSTRFKVKEGDVFLVPRFHPMAQMSFNNDSFIFMGFTTTTRKNYPQFLAGKRSVLQTLNKDILAVSFNVSNTTIDHIVSAQTQSIILNCTSCAEEEEIIMQKEIERKKEEEARKKEEERKREEEEARKREEEEARKREEEEREREEEEARKREEEEREREEEEARKREEEEARKREEEEREREEEEARKREEEEARRREEEEREREEEEEARKREEEEARRREEEEREREEEEEARKREEDEARRRKEEREREEVKKRQQKERERREAEAKREEEEARRQEEERQRRQVEEEEARKEREGKPAGEKSEREESEEGQKKETREEEAGQGGGEGGEGRRFL